MSARTSGVELSEVAAKSLLEMPSRKDLHAVVSQAVQAQAQEKKSGARALPAGPMDLLALLGPGLARGSETPPRK